MKKIPTILLTLFGLGTLAVAIRYSFFGPEIALNLKIIFFALLFADAVCYLIAAWGMWKNIKWIYPLTVALLVVNALAIIFDNIGLIDILAFLVNVIILVLVIYNHNKLANR
jgi:uncharacterized membrane protein